MTAKFNPIKEEVDGKKAHRVVWSTSSLEMALKGLEQGRKLIANPFYENNVKLLKGDLVFERSKEEIAEWKKCKNDIIYFAQYCKLMTPEGIKNVKLRDYQQKYLKHLQNNRLSIYLACRQCGKCTSLITNVLVKFDDEFLGTLDVKLKNKWNSLYYINEHDIYMLPLFELYNLYDNSMLWKLKYPLYKLLYKTICLKVKRQKKIHGNVIIKLISCLDKLEKDDKKLIKSFELDGVYLDTDTGFKPASHIHLTKPFEIYKIKLKNGMWLECADNHIVFDQNMNEIFVKDLIAGQLIQTKDGLSEIIDISHNPYKICMCDITINDNNHRYYTNGILSHNTTTSAIFMLWYILFNIDKNALVLGNKRKTANEILDKVKKIFLELPYFLKPGVYKWNEGEIVLDNGCRCMAEATTINSGISFTFHCVLADEFAHVHPNILEPFYNNLFPTITAGKARFMITSTQNGYNLFYRLYKAAEQGINEYGAFKTDWDEVPEWNPDNHCWEKRDEAWHQKQVANYGSEEAFNKQFGTNFDINANTLIDTKYIKKIRPQAVEFINKYIGGVEYSDRYFWHKDFEPDSDLRRSLLVFTIDISEGIGGDYTTYCINKILDSEGNTECIGIFHANDLSTEQCTRSLQQLICYWCNQDNVLISIEMNLFGDLFIRQLFDNMEEYEDTIGVTFDPSIIIKYYNKNKTDYTYGLKITSGNKTKGCTLFKLDYERGKIINNSTLFLNEIENFCDNRGNNTYAASFGHDDVVMAQIQLVFAKQTAQFKTLLDNLSILNNQAEENSRIYNPYSDMIDIYQLYNQTISSNRNRLS